MYSDDFKIVGGMLGFLAGISMVLYFLMQASCTSIAAEMKVPVRFGLFTGCMIQVKGDWIPLENYRVFGERE